VIYALAYLAAGLIAAWLGARWELRLGMNPNDAISAGAVGFFCGCFWPILAIMYVIGHLAKRSTRP
jgi:hypothetical protein